MEPPRIGFLSTDGVLSNFRFSELNARPLDDLRSTDLSRVGLLSNGFSIEGLSFDFTFVKVLSTEDRRSGVFSRTRLLDFSVGFSTPFSNFSLPFSDLFSTGFSSDAFLEEDLSFVEALSDEFLLSEDEDRFSEEGALIDGLSVVDFRSDVGVLSLDFPLDDDLSFD